MIRLLATLALLLCAACTTTDARQDSTVAAQRTIAPLTDGWSFAFADDWTEVDAAAASGGAWEPVALPHSWNRLGEYRIGRTAATDNRQGKGWYRRTIDGRRLDRARRHFIEFGAVGNVADVWLNGLHVAHHAGAFTRFRGELTDALDSPVRTSCWCAPTTAIHTRAARRSIPFRCSAISSSTEASTGRLFWSPSPRAISRSTI